MAVSRWKSKDPAVVQSARLMSQHSQSGSGPREVLELSVYSSIGILKELGSNTSEGMPPQQGR